MEAGSTAIFLMEYLLRIWVCVEQEQFAHGLIPVTPLGKFFVSVISVLGIGIFALPTAILTAAILDGTQAGDAPDHSSRGELQGASPGGGTGPHLPPCPHCGKHPHQA